MNTIIHNGTCTMHCTLLEDIRISKAAGYDGIEIIGSKLYRLLDQGYDLNFVRDRLAGFPVPAIGFVPDIERRKPDEYNALLEEAERMFSIAAQLGSEFVEILTGPIGPGLGETGGYQGLIGCPWEEVLEVTARNLKELSRIAATHDVKLYLEPLAWAPLHTLDQSLQLLDIAGCDNVGMVIDFWHLWVNGTTAEDIAKVDPDRIYGVHFCDSIPPPEGKPILHSLREVWTGGGHIPLQDWIDAILSTGYNGWWSAEMFAPQYWERNPEHVARLLRENLQIMIEASRGRG